MMIKRKRESKREELIDILINIAKLLRNDELIFSLASYVFSTRFLYLFYNFVVRQHFKNGLIIIDKFELILIFFIVYILIKTSTVFSHHLI